MLNSFINRGMSIADNPRNNPLLTKSTGAIPFEGIVEAIEEFTRIDTSSLSNVSFPYPQLFITSYFIVVCTETEIYEYADGVLTLGYGSMPAGGPWSIVDSKEHLYLVNGKCAIIRDPDTGIYKRVYNIIDNIPYGDCVCNYNGQLLMGGLIGKWIGEAVLYDDSNPLINVEFPLTRQIGGGPLEDANFVQIIPPLVNPGNGGTFIDLGGKTCRHFFVSGELDDAGDLYLLRSTLGSELDTLYKYDSDGGLQSSFGQIHSSFGFDTVQKHDDDTWYYTCVRTHTPSIDTRPTSGTYYTTYWFSGGPAGPAWGDDNDPSHPKYIGNSAFGYIGMNCGTILSDGTFRISTLYEFTIIAVDDTGRETDRHFAFGDEKQEHTSGIQSSNFAGQTPLEIRSDHLGIATAFSYNLSGIPYNKVHLYQPDGSLDLTIGDEVGNTPSRFGSVAIQGICMTFTEVYVADRRNNKIKVFNRTTGVFQREWGTVGTDPGEFSPDSLQGIDTDGWYIFACASTNNKVIVYDLDGTYVTELTGLSTPRQIRLTTLYMYIYEHGSKLVTKYVKVT